MRMPICAAVLTCLTFASGCAGPWLPCCDNSRATPTLADQSEPSPPPPSKSDKREPKYMYVPGWEQTEPLLPFAAGGERVTMQGRSFLVMSREYRFVSPAGRATDRYGPDSRAREYLASRGRWALVPRTNSPEDVGALESRPARWQQHALTPETYVIVCLDPQVVVAGPGRRHYSERRSAWTEVIGSPDRAMPEDTEAWIAALDEPGVNMRYGFIARTTVPYSPDPQWFSPDMKIGPTSAEFVTDDTRRISVPWGALLLTRDGDVWRVTAEPRE